MKKSYKLNILICIISGLIVGSFVFFSTDAENLAKNWRTLDFRWIAAAVLFMVVYWLLEAAILHVMIRPLHKDIKFSGTFRVSMGGQFFNCITPFASGGQPFQANALVKQGVRLGVALNGLLAKFIVYQASLVIVSAAMLILRLDYFRQTVNSFVFIVIIGFLINLAVMAVLVGFALFPNTSRRFYRWLINLLSKMHILKKPEEKIEYFDAEIQKFRDCFRETIKNVTVLIYSFVLSILQLIAYMSVSYAIYRAFGISDTGFITIIAAQSFVMMISAFIPIPGAGLGAEGAFFIFFSRFFPLDGQVGLALVLWRVITFYLTIVVGLFFVLRGGKRKETDFAEAAEEK